MKKLLSDLLIIFLLDQKDATPPERICSIRAGNQESPIASTQRQIGIAGFHGFRSAFEEFDRKTRGLIQQEAFEKASAKRSDLGCVAISTRSFSKNASAAVNFLWFFLLLVAKEGTDII